MEENLEIELATLRPKVLSMAKRFFRASRLEGDPEDVVQDVLLRLWEVRQHGTEIRNVEAWVSACTKNSCVSIWRKSRKARIASLPEDLPEGGNSALPMERADAERKAGEALKRISEGTRRLLELRATGLSLDEIAAVTGRPKGSIKSAISAARKEMVDTLIKNG